jgi:uncharacterized Zn-binding protein involved in type VI secretion
MIGIVRTNQDTAGGLIRPLQTKVRIGSDPVGVVGSPVEAHDPCWVPSPPHCAAVMAEGNPRIRIGSIPICFEGHLASCGHPATGRDKIGQA